MKRWQFIYLALILCGVLSGCFRDKKKEQETKWNVSLERNSKLPYGTYLAYESLKYYFPKAEIEALSRGFRYGNMDDKMKYNDSGRSLIILEGLYLHLSEREWNELREFINRGNEVIIFTSWLDSRIEEELNCSKEGSGAENNKYYLAKEDFENKDVLSLANNPNKKYGYEGRSLKGYFTFKHDSEYTQSHGTAATDETESETTTDTADSGDEETQTVRTEGPPRPDTLGFASGKVDFVRYSIGSGHITLHAAPLALTNYFLLQDGNEKYLTAVWASLPANINRIYWEDFYYRKTEESSMSILWRYPATRYAMTLAIVALLLYVLFESKRKQRIIPIIPPLKNESVSFVETVGRLYYNKGNHTNLAEKMIQQFLEWVRSNYFLNTSQLNDHFIRQLTIKSGQPESMVRGLLDMIQEIKLGTAKTDDAYLYQLYSTIQQFYKNKRR